MVTARLWSAACALLLLLASACKDRLTLGEQCPAPNEKSSTLAEGASRGGVVYGTSCAPCRPVRYDKRGCPKYVTWESCGGDICIGTELVRAPAPRDAGIDAGDAGHVDAAAAPGDGGPAEEDDGGP